MKVQRVQLPDSQSVTWLVLDDAYLPIEPIRQFLVYLENLERSPHTIRAYAGHLKRYWDYLHATRLDWTLVGIGELANFVAWLRQPQPRLLALHEQVAPRTVSTINAILTAVTMFYDYHQRAGTGPAIPLYRDHLRPYRRYKSYLHHLTKAKPIRSRLIKLKPPRHHPKTLTEEQVNMLVAACQRLRDKFLLKLLYETGMRIGQALGLRHEDIRSWDNEIRIVPRNENVNRARAKTTEPYTIHVSTDLMALYADYLIAEFGTTDSDYVFVNLWEGRIGAPMQYETVADLFRRLSKKANLRVHAHMLRHTHATELIRNGWDAALVQKRLGHASIQTTINMYTHLSDSDLKAAYQQYQATRK